MDKKTIYNLGQVCAIIWPFSGDIPPRILNLICSHPATLLAEMTKHKDNTDKKQEALAEIIDKINDIYDPPNGVSLEEQSPFWIGYYHYKGAADRANKYGPHEMEIAGKTLFGDRWQTDLANALDLSDARRIRQWMAKERPIPVGVWADILGLLRHKQMSIETIVKNFEGTE